METKILIRKIVADDNAALAIIIRSALKEFNANKPGTVYFDNTTDSLSEIFKVKKSAYFVLPENTCELVKMYLSKKFRKKGFGQMLLEKCMAEAMKTGFEKMYIETMPELTNAISMYEKNGFQFIYAPLGNSGHTGCDVWMIKSL